MNSYTPSEEVGPAAVLNLALPDIIMFARNAERERLNRYGLSLTQFFAMAVLARRGTCMMRELGEELDLSMGAITGIMDRLVELGFAERHAVETDRRVVMAELTVDGKRAFEKVSMDRSRAIAEIITGISEDNMRIFLEVLNRIIGSLAGQTQESAARVI